MKESGADSPDGHAVYVFAVCGAPVQTAVADLPGVAAGTAVRTLPFGELTAVVQTVRAADFADEAWQARLSDTRELERYARAHHHVVTVAAAACPTVPLPLATLYHDEERALSALSGETGRFRAALARTADHSEWGVKVYAAERPPQDAERPVAEVGTAPRGPAEPAGRTRPAPGAGLAYLDRKRGCGHGANSNRKKPSGWRRRWTRNSSGWRRLLEGCGRTAPNWPVTHGSRCSTPPTWSRTAGPASWRR